LFGAAGVLADQIFGRNVVRRVLGEDDRRRRPDVRGSGHLKPVL